MLIKLRAPSRMLEGISYMYRNVNVEENLPPVEEI